MSRHQHIASLLSLSVLVAVPLGCGQPNPSGVWDAAPKTWEAAPPREIVEGNGTGDGGAVGTPNNGSGSFTKMCKMPHEAWCCFDGVNVTGIPLCPWRSVGPGEIFVITEAFKANQKVTLP